MRSPTRALLEAGPREALYEASVILIYASSGRNKVSFEKGQD